MDKIKVKTKGMVGTKIDSTSKVRHEPVFEVTSCLLCGELFEDSDKIIDLHGDALHEDECFIEWCLELYGPSERYKEFKEE